MIGDSGVGKTCLLFRFTDDTFSSSFISTIGIDFKIKTIEIDGKTIKLQIWDTAGQERFQTITQSYYRGARGIMLVYDITNRRSYENIDKWMTNIRMLASSEVETLVVGNKSDLEEQRCVSYDEGAELAAKHNVPFLETSSKGGINVDDAFRKLSRAILWQTPSKETETQSPISGHLLNQSSTFPLPTYCCKQ
ncbi:unnamed protein product [Protopolystoma xenopodis]|uniref:Ras-related protein Rab-1 n=1 Tax=Protopolystoma xenopodis TaxID=117903 RepID=A0A448X6T0_9PLAT|nr:unnamed protein product [Protopolystoma xenopodis]